MEQTKAPLTGEWALVVVDMQNDFLATGGYYARRGDLDREVECGTLTLEARDDLLRHPGGAPPGPYTSRAQGLDGVVARIAAVIGHARAEGRPVAYLRALYGRDLDACPPFLAHDLHREHYPCKPGSWGAAFIEPIERLVAARPAPDRERVIDKHTLDGCFHTPLLPFLRERGARTVVVVGVETHACVLATAQSAAIAGFPTLILEDCVWTARDTLGPGALAIFRDAFGSTTTSDACWPPRPSSP